MKLDVIEPDVWKQRYEALRQHVVERRQIMDADPLGLTLVVKNGLAGWMHTWQASFDGASPTPAPMSPWPPSASTSAAELTRLLAQMTQQHLRPSL